MYVAILFRVFHSYILYIILVVYYYFILHIHKKYRWTLYLISRKWRHWKINTIFLFMCLTPHRQYIVTLYLISRKWKKTLKDKLLLVICSTKELFHTIIAQSMKRKIEFDREIPDFRTFYGQAENVFQSKRVDQVYKSTAKYNGALGASGYNGPIYGELTQHSMHKLLEIMIDNCQLSTTSRFLDVGSGIAKPNLHALQFPGVSLSIGVEIEKLRWQVTCIALIASPLSHHLLFPTCLLISWRCLTWQCSSTGIPNENMLHPDCMG